MSSSTAMKQEGFLIPEENSQRRKIVRQDRVPVAPKKCYLLLGELKLEIMNVSSFGLAAICTEKDLTRVQHWFDKSSARETTILFNEVEVQKVVLKVARSEQHPHSVFNDHILGFEVIGNPISVDCVKALELADEMVTSSKETLVEMQTIPEKFRLTVFEMKEFLLQLKDKIDEIEKMAPRDNATENSDFRETIAQSVSDYLSKIIPTKYQQIPSIVSGVDEKTFEACTKFIRTQLGALVYGAPFANRAYTKPRGYAGDYEMMNHLYRDEIVGTSLFNQCMHRYFIDEPAAQAVKNRGYYLLEKIQKTVRESKKSKIRILAVASGPAMEQQLFLRNCEEFKGKQIEFVCIDQDEESLKHAQRQMLSIERFVKSGFQFKFMNLAIKNILAKGLPEGEFDLIYTAGLFDYFTDPVAQMAGQRLAEGLTANGTLIIGNFSMDNPTRPLMEMVLEWHLIYRSVEDMKRLFGHVGKSVEVEQEKLGINLFAVIKT